MGIRDEIEQSIKGHQVLIESMTSALRNHRSMTRNGRFDNGVAANYRAKIADARKAVRTLRRELTAVSRNSAIESVLNRIIERIDNIEDRLDNVKIEV